MHVPSGSRSTTWLSQILSNNVRAAIGFLSSLELLSAPGLAEHGSGRKPEPKGYADERFGDNAMCDLQNSTGGAARSSGLLSRGGAITERLRPRSASPGMPG